jgi:dolichol-phosphate mannosyltransferase
VDAFRSSGYLTSPYAPPRRPLIGSAVARTIIFIPTYNEADNVTPMCEAIVGLGLDADLVFMDDNSPDGTGRILDELAKKHPRVSVIHRSKKSGIGSAHMAGIRHAYEHGYQLLVTLDCDFTHSPSLITVFLEHARTADVVIGSRFVNKDSLPGWTLARKVLTSAGHLLTEKLLGVTQDATGAFRVYNLETIPLALFDLAQSRGYAFFFETLLIVNRNGFSIVEVPIKLPARSAGHSKMDFVEIQRSVKTLFDLSVEDWRDPQRFLLPEGVRRPPRRP